MHLGPDDALSEQRHTGAAPFENPRSPAPLLARFCKGTVASSASERTTPGTTPVRVSTFVLPSARISRHSSGPFLTHRDMPVSVRQTWRPHHQRQADACSRRRVVFSSSCVRRQQSRTAAASMRVGAPDLVSVGRGERVDAARLRRVADNHPPRAHIVQHLHTRSHAERHTGQQ